MLFPGDGIDGIKRFYLDTLVAFGKRGLACQPAIVGVGLGGSKDISMVLGKQAACLRAVGDRHPDPRIATLELELKELGNNIGMGAMGFVGSSMVVDCHIEVGHTHTGGYADECAHLLPLVASGDGTGGGGRHHQLAHRPAVVHALHAAGDGGLDERRNTLAHVDLTSRVRRRTPRRWMHHEVRSPRSV